MQLTAAQQRVYTYLRYEIRHGNHRIYHAAIADAMSISKGYARRIVYALRAAGLITISYPFEVNSRDREAPIYRLAKGRVTHFFGKSQVHPIRKESLNTTPPLPVEPTTAPKPRRFTKSVADLTRHYAAQKRRMERNLAAWADLSLPALRSELERFTNYAQKRPCVFLRMCVEKLERIVLRHSAFGGDKPARTARSNAVPFHEERRTVSFLRTTVG